MENILFTSVVLIPVNVFLLIYISTLHLYAKAWIDKTNSSSKSWNPKVNNRACTGILVTVTSLLMCFSWGFYFYYLIF